MVSLDITIEQLAELFETREEISRTEHKSGLVESVFKLKQGLGEALVFHGVGEGGVMVLDRVADTFAI